MDHLRLQCCRKSCYVALNLDSSNSAARNSGKFISNDSSGLPCQRRSQTNKECIINAFT
jgi:hypothetical protein